LRAGWGKQKETEFGIAAGNNPSKKKSYPWGKKATEVEHKPQEKKLGAYQAAGGIRLEAKEELVVGRQGGRNCAKLRKKNRQIRLR